MVVYVNYELVTLQLERLNQLSGEWRLLICDNTPKSHYKPLEISDSRVQIFRKEFGGIDGEKHGKAIDLLVQQATSDIIGICDSDFFWLKNDILERVQSLFDQGNQCVGAELYYEDFEKVNKRYPDRAGYLCPCVFGMFTEKNLAKSETYVVTGAEGNNWFETGWRLRKKIIDEKIPCYVFSALKLHPEETAWFYGNQKEIVGLHLLKGSGRRANKTNQIVELMKLADRINQLHRI